MFFFGWLICGSFIVPVMNRGVMTYMGKQWDYFLEAEDKNLQTGDRRWFSDMRFFVSKSLNVRS